MIQEITDETFEAEVKSKGGVAIVDFWAVWCGPCRALSPVIDELAGDYGDSVRVYKMNIDENQSVPAELGIMSIPTVLIFKDGELAQKSVGLKNKAALKSIIDPLL